MYQTSGMAGVAASGAGLAAAGVNVVWLLLGAFALLGAGLALLRLIPRRQA
jgi:hypothetical protein